ncbi:DUF485 domain-containing protein [Streptomyces sp. bgisy159]|uniref:DUF485 domain-containing protein n=1 Tax=Streptomyces sp. bgisy159 TaxID=3413795 RepID=UPI003F4A38B2
MHFSNGRLRTDGDGRETSGGQGPGRSPATEGAPGEVRYDDPWYDALAAGWGEPGLADAPGVAAEAERRDLPEGAPEAADIYLRVQRGAAFQEVRDRYRGFVVPASAGFFLWYLAYVVAATTAPGLMAHRVIGAVNVGLLAGLGQFLTTFVLTWAYARHARLRRDRAALELRWETQELTRAARGGVS